MKMDRRASAAATVLIVGAYSGRQHSEDMTSATHGTSMFTVIVFLALATHACDRAVAPRRNRLSDLRQQATAGLGTFYGRVRALDPALPCWKAPLTVAGVQVEVGLWDGSPAYYRDTLTHAVPSSLDEPRFEAIAWSVTDSDGRFRFVDLPRAMGYAMRVIPPTGSQWRVSYGETMYGIPEGADLADFPTLCVRAR